MYHLFLDDVREPNKFLNDDLRSWVIVRDYNDFVNTITNNGLPKFISMDHDLSIEQYYSEYNSDGIDYSKYKEKSGYDCAKWLIEYCIKTKQSLPEYQVHSLNPIGKQNIIQILENYKKYETN